MSAQIIPDALRDFRKGTLMRRFLILVASVLVGGASALAQTDLTTSRSADGTMLHGYVPFCRTGVNQDVVPCGGIGSPMYVMSMPFVRATQDVNRFEGVSTTAKTFAISRPAGATSYRFVNPCDVDVRIRKVDSASEVITPAQGTLFLARTSETLGTSDPQFVSLIAMSPPTGSCTPELGYGNGG